MRATLRPLRPEEKAVAQQNYWIVERFLKAQQLPSDDWFDVVIFRYLLTVQNWFNRPELYRYEFSTIAWAAMRSAVSNERKKQRRRIHTISLDEVIPGSENIKYGDIITAKNLDYVPYLQEV